jgi:hypothetical protein
MSSLCRTWRRRILRERKIGGIRHTVRGHRHAGRSVGGLTGLLLRQLNRRKLERERKVS